MFSHDWQKAEPICHDSFHHVGRTVELSIAAFDLNLPNGSGANVKLVGVVRDYPPMSLFQLR